MNIAVKPKAHHEIIADFHFLKSRYGKLKSKRKIAYSPTAMYECADIIGRKPISMPARNAALISFSGLLTKMLKSERQRMAGIIENRALRCGRRKRTRG